jgi:hypothetical protein
MSIFSMLTDRPPLGVFGVGQPLRAASGVKAPPAWFGPPLLPSVARGVFQPDGTKKCSLPDVRRADARSRDI